MSTTQSKTQTAQVTCITKADRTSTHEGITHLGGEGWQWTRAQVIAAIENKSWAFYTNVGGQTAWVRVVQGPYGKYVQTYANGRWTNNLLSLPECR